MGLRRTGRAGWDNGVPVKYGEVADFLMGCDLAG